MRVVSIAAAIVLVACGSSTSQEGDTTPPVPEPQPAAPPPAPPEPAAPPVPQPVELSVRVLHAAANAATKNLSATYATGTDTPGGIATDLAFGAATGYSSATLPPGTTGIGLSLSAEGIDPLSFAGAITAGEPHTALIVARAEGGNALSADMLHDAVQAPDAGKTRVRFVHAVLGWDAVDVCAPGENARAAGTPVFANARYGRATGSDSSFDRYMDMPAGLTTVQVREANTEAPCSGRVVGVATIAPPAGGSLDAQNVTLVAVGRATGRPAVPRALLLCLDSPAPQPSCTSLPMRAR
jgi:hypothetical protein